MGMSYIYILHFHEPLAHARHYIGCTANLHERLKTHASGRGARITEVLAERGITWELGGLYSCTHAEMRRHEKGLKSIKNSERFCQLCHPANQVRVPRLQTENVRLVRHHTHSSFLATPASVQSVYALPMSDEANGMEFILSLMRKDKDALGFVPVGGEKGIKALLERKQIIIANEGSDRAGYAFYTQSPDKTLTNIHQACVADAMRLRGHGERIVQYIANQQPESTLVAKVRDDLAANHFWTALGFKIDLTKTHKTSGSTIHHYTRPATITTTEVKNDERVSSDRLQDVQNRRGPADDTAGELHSPDRARDKDN